MGSGCWPIPKKGFCILYGTFFVSLFLFFRLVPVFGVVDWAVVSRLLVDTGVLHIFKLWNVRGCWEFVL